jgi:hypothetical protein
MSDTKLKAAMTKASDEIRLALLRFEETTGRIVEQVDIDCDGSVKFVVTLLLAG